MCPQFYWERPVAELLDLATSLVWIDGWGSHWLSLPAELMATGWGGVGAIATSAAVVAALSVTGRFKPGR